MGATANLISCFVSMFCRCNCLGHVVRTSRTPRYDTFRCFSTAQRTRSAHAVATFTKLKSGSGRVQVRRKGKYLSETFLRRKDAEGWAIDEERRIDRGEPSTKRKRRDARTFGDLIRLHMADLREVGKPIGRSKAASLRFLESRLGACEFPNSRS